jgi:hypothetical protein
MLRGGDELRRWLDLVTGAFLALGTGVYCAALPLNLGTADEAHYLYHAKRVLDGQVLYRDIFDFQPPVFVDLVALLFRVAPIELVSVRAANAVVCGVIVALLYYLCRRLCVSWCIASAIALAFPALCYSAWPYASPHWLSTLWTLLLAHVSLDRVRARRLPSLLLQGVVVGTLISTQQQRGIILGGLGSALLLLLDVLTDRRYGAREGIPWAGRALVIGGMAAAVVLAILLPHFLQAGLGPVVDQLLVYPFTGYRRRNNSMPWGGMTFLSFSLHNYTNVAVLKLLPVSLPAATLACIPSWRVARDRSYVEGVGTIVVLGVASVGGILYFPDFIHLAFAAPLCLAAAAVLTEGLLDRLYRVVRVARIGTSALLLAVLGTYLWRNMARAHAEFPFVHTTAFGRVAFASRDEIERVEQIRALANEMPSRELFCYPVHTATYLMTATDNPTPYNILLPGYQDDTVLREVIDTLEHRRVPLVLLIDTLITGSDPVADYVHEHYRCERNLVCVRVQPTPAGDRGESNGARRRSG